MGGQGRLSEEVTLEPRLECCEVLFRAQGTAKPGVLGVW